MLFFACISRAEADEVAREGLRRPVKVVGDPGQALAAGSEAVLVIDALDPEVILAENGQTVIYSPRRALLNALPYLDPEPVTAAGGYVTRHTGTGPPEVLMIFRRGCWDFPKGKQDAGENIEECALREVGEEIGITRLEIRRALPETMHAYRQRRRFYVKTTHWFEMSTPERQFTPQRSEGIERIEWVAWMSAVEKVAFETLRRHMMMVLPMISR